MRQVLSASAFIAAFSLLTGCASVVDGTNQSVSVVTAPTQGAICTLENDKGTWYVNDTPGSVTVHRSIKDLTISCKKHGYRPSERKVASSVKGWAFGNILFGLGGIIGAGVDMADGAAFDYPISIQVPMEHVG